MSDETTQHIRNLTDKIFFQGRIKLINIFIDKLSLRNQMILLAGATLLGNTLIIGMLLLTKSNNLQNILTGYIVIGFFSLVFAGYLGTCAGKKAELVVDALNELTKGNLTKKLKIPGRDEFAWMSYEYNNTLKAINKIVKEMNVLILGLQEGKLDIRGNADSFSGKWKELVNGFNKLIEALVTPINMTAEYIDKIGRGDIPEIITSEYKGDLNYIKTNLNKCIEAINGLVAETVMLTEGAVEGKLDIRGDVEKFGGDYAKIVNGINNTLDAVISPLNVTAEYMDRISKGDFPEQIEDEYKGDFKDIINSLNLMIANLQGTVQLAEKVADGDLSVEVNILSEKDVLGKSLSKMVSTISTIVKDINHLTDDVLEGNLEIRGEANKFSGEYSRIMIGVNNTLNAVVNPLKVTAEYVNRISRGEIPNKITEEYKGDFNEYKNSINTMIKKLGRFAVDIQKIAETLSLSSKEVSQNAEQLSEGTSEQAASIEQISASMEEMDAIVNNNAEDSRKTAKIVAQSSKNAWDGKKNMEETVNALKTI